MAVRHLIAGVALWLGVAHGRASARPNFLIVLADNVGRDWFGCYGARQARTPHLDGCNWK